MLRITVNENDSEQRWTLQGRLTQECVAELVSNWRAARSLPSAKIRIVDLNENTVIDKSGEEVLSMMIGEGPRFVANGLYTKHLLSWKRCMSEQEIPGFTIDPGWFKRYSNTSSISASQRTITFSRLGTGKAPD